MPRLVPVVGVVAALLVLAGCRVSDEAPAPPPPPTIVNVTPPASDGGLSVLLTIALGCALLGLVAAVVLGALWLHERGRRQTSEDMVVELTGLPAARARVAVAAGKTPVVRMEAQAIAHEEPRALRP